MRLLFVKFTVSLLLVSPCMLSHALDMVDLSLTPLKACKMPPKSPPYQLLHKEYQSYSITTNWPFDHSIDINGDGWCDWVSRPSEFPHQNDSEEPKMEDFIFMGTSTGWRKFGNMKKFMSDISGLNKEGGWIYPDLSVFGFLDTHFIYSNENRTPYIVVLAPIFDNRLSPKLEDIQAYQWNNTFDMLHEVDEEKKRVLIEFLKIQSCKAEKKYGDGFALEDVICRKK